jgi:ATP-dependent Zn protease
MSNADKRRRKRSRGSGRSHLGLYSVLAVIVLLGAYVAVLAYSKPQVGGDALRLDTFVRYIGANRIKDARVLDEDSVITGDYVRDDKTVGPYNAPYLKTSGSQETLVDQLVRKRVPTTIDQQFSKKLIFPATILIPSLIVIVVFVYLLLSYRRGTGLFGVKSGARKWDADAPQVTFADVAGQEAAIDELR